MNKRSLPGIRLGLRNLFTERQADLLLSNAGKAYAPALQLKMDALDGFHAAAIDPTKSVTEQLGVADIEHDGLGHAIWHFTEAYLRHPFMPAHVTAAALRVREAFIPARSELREPYAVEAQRAHDRKADLIKYKADLELFPAVDGKTLYDWASDFIASGEKIDHLLNARADAPDNSRKDAPITRSEVVGLLIRFRNALRDELKYNKALPADLEERFFGYFDELDRMRAANATNTKKPAPADKPQNIEG